MSIKHPQAVADTYQTIPARFREMVGHYPENPAVCFGDHILSYKQLDNESDRLAGAILKKSGDVAERVGIYLEHGIQQPLAILSILKAGKTYVALDPDFPLERNLQMLNNSNCSILLTNNMHIDQVRSFSSGTGIINMDSDIKDDAAGKLPEVSPDTPAFITYTSGSTGIPKGVVHSHANMLDFVLRMYHIECTLPEHRWAYYYSLSFSAHAMPIFGALLNGAALCIFNLKKDSFSDFGRWLKQEKITTCLMIPSILRQFTSTLGDGRRFPKLTHLLLGGETLYRSDIEKIRPHLKAEANIHNIYASSEVYLARAYKIESNTIIKGNNVPIGYAVPGMDIYIEEEAGSRSDPYKSGEICITGRHLAQGYWGQEELTAQDFVKNNDGTVTFRSKDLGYKMSDGCIVHLGRSDSMVKLRGYRIDLGEIENTVMELKQVKEIAVVVKENNYGTKHIIGYYVQRENTELDEHYLRLAVLRNLPEYMVPSHFIKLDHLPKNTIGKIDYRNFPEPDWDSFTKDKNVELPANSNEEELKEIFERILEVNPIGVTESIMEVGADSLRLFVAFDEVEKRFGKKLDVDAIIEKPFIRDIAKMID